MERQGLKHILKQFISVFCLGITLCVVLDCSKSPKPIEYGVDNCKFCDMTIIDIKHAAEIVTHTGKAYKFDAIECMIRFSIQKKTTKYTHQLITDFSNPGILIDAKQATFLISPNLPSPMGAFLSGFSSIENAQSAQAEFNGELYNWTAIQKIINQ